MSYWSVGLSKATGDTQSNNMEEQDKQDLEQDGERIHFYCIVLISISLFLVPYILSPCLLLKRIGGECPRSLPHPRPSPLMAFRAGGEERGCKETRKDSLRMSLKKVLGSV